MATFNAGIVEAFLTSTGFVSLQIKICLLCWPYFSVSHTPFNDEDCITRGAV